MWYYELGYSHIGIEGLRRAVSTAERARQNLDHAQVDELFRQWVLDLLQDNETRHILKDARRLELVQERDLIRVGMAGLIRIKHVDLNSLLGESSGEKREPILQEVVTTNRVYKQLGGLRKLPSFSIDWNSMSWWLENVQDWMSTYEKMGDEEGAGGVAIPAIVEGRGVLRGLRAADVDLKTPNDVLKARDYSAFILRRQFLGTLSALGVILVRNGKRDHSLFAILEGLNLVVEGYTHEPNSHRLATLALWTIQAAVSGEYKTSLPDRTFGLGSGLVQLIRANRGDAVSSLSSLRQMIRERHRARG